MNFFNRTPIEDFFWRKGRFIVFSDLTAEEQALLGPPQFQVGQTVVVKSPWWWKHRVTGEQMRPNLKCIVTEAPGYFHRHGDGGHYGLTVKDANNPGAHSRSISEADIEGFVPNPLYPPE